MVKCSAEAKVVASKGRVKTNFSFKISKHPSCLVLVKVPSRFLVFSTNPIPSAPSSHLHSFQNLSQNFQNLSR